MDHFLVVGGSARLAQASIGLFLEKGASVSTLDMRVNASSHVRLKNYGADLTIDEDVERAISSAIGDSGPVNSVVFFARHATSVEGLESRDDWFSSVGVGLRAPHLVLSWLTKKGPNQGSLSSAVLVGSVLGQFVSLNQTASYHATKAGTEGLIRFMALEFLSHGVRVNGLAPGYVADKTMQKSSPTLEKPTLPVEVRGKPFPAANPDQIASICYFLCSNDSEAINGQVLTADAGLSTLEQLGLLS